MLGRAQAGELLRITKLVVGSGHATTPDELWPLTTLLMHEMNVTISTTRDLGDGTLVVEGSFRSDQAPHAFDLCELGVMAHLGTEADRLYSVANVFADDPDHIDPAAPTMQVFKMKLIIDRIPSGNITVTIGPSEVVTGENLLADTVGPGVYKETAGNVLKFKRIKEGANMDIHEEDGGSSIYIGTSVLANSVDLYVPLTYPSPPSGALLFPTIQAAHDYLLTFHIPADKFATIHLAAGLFQGAGNSPVSFGHPDSSQIRVTGWPRVDKTITAGPNYVASGNRKNVTVSGSVADLYVGQPVYVFNADPGWNGGCYITAKSGNVITLSTLFRDSQGIYTINNTGGFGTPRLSYFPSIIYLANPNPGQPWAGNTVNVACGAGMGVSNLCIIGGYHALHMSGRCGITNVQCFCTGGAGGVGIAGGDPTVIGWPSDIVVSDCGTGITGNIVGHNIGVRIIVNACDLGMGTTGGAGAIPGVGATNPAQVQLIHCGAGARNWGQVMEFGFVLYVKNDTGFDAAHLGAFIFGSVGGNWPALNGTDLYAHGMGYIAYTKGGGGEPSCSPVKNTYGLNANSFISVN
jgi:hypothetical protein